MNLADQQLLLQIARETIQLHFIGQAHYIENIPREFLEQRGIFVTLTRNQELRGCIGYIQPIKSIYEAIKENAINAAFHDPRFKPLEEEELSQIKIEISLLTVPQKLTFSSPADLVKKLRPKIDGVILEKNNRSATFLPQVWEQLPDPFEFLENLTWKAGLTPHAWETAEIKTYQAEVFLEE